MIAADPKSSSFLTGSLADLSSLSNVFYTFPRTILHKSASRGNLSLIATASHHSGCSGLPEKLAPLHFLAKLLSMSDTHSRCCEGLTSLLILKTLSSGNALTSLRLCACVHVTFWLSSLALLSIMWTQATYTHHTRSPRGLFCYRLVTSSLGPGRTDTQRQTICSPRWACCQTLTNVVPGFYL